MNVTPRKWYVVTTDSECVVTDANGKVLCTATAGEQKLFYATTPVVTLSDETATVGEANFKRALAALGLLGGGNNGLPAGYTRVEFLESTGGQGFLVDTPVTSKTGVSVRFMQTSNQTWTYVWGGRDASNGYIVIGVDGGGKPVSAGALNKHAELPYSSAAIYNSYINYKNNGKYMLETEEAVSEVNGRMFITAEKTCLFGLCNVGGTSASFSARAKVYVARFTHESELVREMLPCVDATGTPCMFDLVTRKPFYNSGTGDFLYPGKEQQATTYSLRRPRMYAQMTEHGIRRLYHVPRGYNGSPEEYAEEHGFKILVETPQPEEGYWAPVWHDREDCIELEWVETEPPAEKLLTEA